jgi:hypothetical protein
MQNAHPSHKGLQVYKINGCSKVSDELSEFQAFRMAADEIRAELPFRIVGDSEKYIRLQYSFCPQSVGAKTVRRSLIFDEDHPNVAFVDHHMRDGNMVRFKGNWKEKSETVHECVLVFGENEVVCIPVSGSVLHLKKD